MHIHWIRLAMVLATVALATWFVWYLVTWPTPRRRRAERPSIVDVEVLHVGATAQWSPEAQMHAVPHKPLGPEEAKRVAEDHEAAIWEDQQRTYAAAFRDLELTEQRAIDDTFEGLIRRANRIGHLERDTCEITSELMADVLARGRP